VVSLNSYKKATKIDLSVAVIFFSLKAYKIEEEKISIFSPRKRFDVNCYDPLPLNLIHKRDIKNVSHFTNIKNP